MAVYTTRIHGFLLLPSGTPLPVRQRRGPNEESVTDFWPHLTTWHPKTWLPDAMEVYTFNSWKDVGGSDTWVKCLSDEGPLWWTYHCSEPKEGIFWKKAKWSGGRRMDWEKMHKTKSPKAKPELVLRLRGQVTDSANAKAKAKAKAKAQPRSSDAS